MNDDIKPSSFFDNLGAWSVSQDYLAGAVAKKKFSARVRKPHKQTFFRVHPAYELTTLIVELDEARETYIVAPELRGEVSAEFPESVRAACLVFCVSKTGDYFVWPVKLPDPNGRANHWAEAAISAVKDGREQWIKLVANMSAGTYDVFTATAPPSEPTWPEQTWPEILEVTFNGRIISTLDHAVLQQLRGAI